MHDHADHLGEGDGAEGDQEEEAEHVELVRGAPDPHLRHQVSWGGLHVGQVVHDPILSPSVHALENICG